MQKTLFPPHKKKSRNPFVQPFLKWAGGKRQLLPAIRPLLPAKIERYYEPFLGGGAVFFDLMPQNAIVNDLNMELINCYTVIRDQPEELLETFRGYNDDGDEDTLYYTRDMDDAERDELSPLQRATRILYLNRMYLRHVVQVDEKGNSTVPYDPQATYNFADPVVFRAVSLFLNRHQIEITSVDYARSVEGAGKGDFVYFDPPADFVSDSASFTGYNLNSFGRDEQKRLKATCDELTDKGVKWLLSNSNTRFIRQLYSMDGTTVREVKGSYQGGHATGLGDVTDTGELMVANYKLPPA